MHHLDTAHQDLEAGSGAAVSRRHFLARAAGSAAALTAFTAWAGKAPGGWPSPLRLGAPVFDAPADPEGLARAHRQLGYRAAYCPDVALTDPDRIRAFRDAFAKHDVVIAEVGRWVNLLDPDSAKREANLKTVAEGLALADEIDARCCVDIAGSFNPSIWYGPHPENLSRRFFDATVENARKLLDAVKPRRTKFCYEMMGWALPDSPDSYLEMIKAIDRRGFGVHLDPCNLINSPGRFYENTALLNECFDKLGRWIVSCHAKDLIWDVEMNLRFREVQPGLGTLDYGTYLRRLAALPEPPPLMIEHLADADEYLAARKHIFAVGERERLQFAP